MKGYILRILSVFLALCTTYTPIANPATTLSYCAVSAPTTSDTTISTNNAVIPSNTTVIPNNTTLSTGNAATFANTALPNTTLSTPITTALPNNTTATLTATSSGTTVYTTSSRYACAQAYDVYFCQSRSTSSALFTIPYSYCVEVLGEENGWYTVKYAEDYGIYRALYGYCSTASLTILSQKPEVVWLYKEVTVTFSADSPQGSLPVLDNITASAAFYGTYYAGPTPYAYVLCGSSFGYVAGTDITYTINQSTQETPEPDEDKSTEQTDATDQSPSIGAVICICLFATAVLILLFFLTRKSRPSP